MLTTAVLITVGFLPLYMWLRAPFLRLPLHIDTGFYVSNDTIITGRIDFSKGWNARFAGCSKVVPEFFYSLIYLRYGRAKGKDHPQRTWSYPVASRFYASLFNYVTAIAVGVLACQLGGGDLRFYFAGLIVFALLSSEPQYGVYFECGEFFSILGNVVSLSLLYVGLTQADPLWIGIAAFLWALEAFFVKLSSAVAMVVVFGWALVTEPHAWAHIVAGGALAVAFYLAWIIKNGRNPFALLRAIGRHESSYGQRADWRAVAHRLVEKLRCLCRSFHRQPVIPALVLAGAFIAPPEHSIIWLYLAAVLTAYMAQATDCWYYQVPLLPPIALLAGGTVVLLASSGWPGVGLLVIGAAIWVMRNSIRAQRLDRASLNRWCWRGYRPEEETGKNLLLEDVARGIGATIGSGSLLVYGPYNQAYTLLNTSYPTSIVAPEYYMDDVCPGWQEELTRQLVLSPPDFILDTSVSFAAQTTRDSVGLDYRITHTFDEAFRLYRLTEVGMPQQGFVSVNTYCPQSRALLAAEEQLADDEAVRRLPTECGMSGVSLAAVDPQDRIGEILRELLESLARDGFERIAVYGAGRFTTRHADVYRASDTTVAVILDDRPSRHGSTFLDWPIATLHDAEKFKVDAIIVSTDRFTHLMARRARGVWKKRIPVFTLDVPAAKEDPVACAPLGLAMPR